MKRRKGQYIDLITVSILLFIATGSLLGAFTINNKISESVEYNIGDMSRIAEAEMKSQFVETRIRKEANYTASIVALNLDEKEGGAEVEWRRIGGETEPSKAKSALRERYLSNISEKLGNQAKVAGGCEDKEIEDVEARDIGAGGIQLPTLGSIDLEEVTVLDVKLNDSWITCSGDYMETKVKMDSAGEITAGNYRNQYIKISETAVEVANRTNLNAPSDDDWEEGEGDDTSSCGPNPDRRETIEDARMEARYDAEKDSSFHTEGFEDIPDSLDAEGDTAINYEYYDRDVSSEDCTYTVTVDVPCEDEEESDCTETETRDGTEIHAEIKVDVESMDLEYVLRDDLYSIMDSTGEKKNIEFEFDYRIRLE